MHATWRQRILITLSSLGMAAALSACGADSITIPTDDGNISVDQGDNGEFELDSDEGSITGKAGSLPDGFPEDEVPLVEGNIIAGVGVNTDSDVGFTISLTPSGDDGLDAAVALLTSKGFTVESTIDMGVGQTTTLTSPRWNVLVALTDVEGDRTFTYTVVPAGS